MQALLLQAMYARTPTLSASLSLVRDCGPSSFPATNNSQTVALQSTEGGAWHCVRQWLSVVQGMKSQRTYPVQQIRNIYT